MPPIDGGVVDCGARLEQQADDEAVAMLRGEDERRAAAALQLVHRCSPVQQPRDQLCVPVARREHERGPPIGCSLIDGDALVE